ncbi:MAG: hypothetical protein ACTHK0_12090 [Ginsengibacter sp.]
MSKNLQSLQNHDSFLEDCEHNPRVSIIIRFEPKMKQKGVLENILAARAKEAEAELLQKYPAQLVNPVMLKLRNMMKRIKKDAHQSIAIFVCPLSEKVIYFTYNSYLSDFNRTHPLRPLKSID